MTNEHDEEFGDVDEDDATDAADEDEGRDGTKESFPN